MEEWKYLDIWKWREWASLLVNNDDYEFEFNRIKGLNNWRKGRLKWFIPVEANLGTIRSEVTYSIGRFIDSHGYYSDECRYRKKVCS